MLRFALFILLTISFQMWSKSTRLDLRLALEKKLVSATILSLGSYQGSCINMTLKNLGKDSLSVMVGAGTRLNSQEDKYQDILVTRNEIIVLRGYGERSAKIKGYCCQASKCSPRSGAKYDLNITCDSNLVKLGRYLSTGDFEPGVEQYAVWAVSDRKPIANITSTRDGILPLKQFVADLKGEVLPWYEIVSNTIVQRDGLMATIPLRLTGSIRYSLGKTEYVTLYIRDKSGLAVCFTKSQWLLPASDQKYEIDIPLKELAKGKYTVELICDKQELVKQEFEI